MAGFLSKPIRAEALAAALADHLAPPPPHTSSVSACLEELRTSAGADVVAAAVAAFLSDAPAGMAALAAALAAGDLEQARRHAHTLKGECATLGLTATADACAGLLEAARAGDVAGARMQQAAVAAAFAIELPEVSAARTA
jgi:HPt (histidine-containing phosphotransfer) domain-containing protein